MILETSNVSGGCLAALVKYAHSKENLLFPNTFKVYTGVVEITQIEAMVKTPRENSMDDIISYHVALKLAEWYEGEDGVRRQVDCRHLLRVYEILGENHPNVCGRGFILSHEVALQLYSEYNFAAFLAGLVPYCCVDLKGNLLYEANRKLTKTMLLRLIKHLHQLHWGKGVEHRLVSLLEEIRLKLS